MNPSLQWLARIGVVVLTAGIAGCGVLPQRGETAAQAELAAAEAALTEFAADESLEPFFAQAEIVAVYPNGFRGGFGFGGAIGHGLVFQRGQVIGRSSMYQLSVGANIGGQFYRQVLFFKSEAAFERVMADVMEFAGQANLAVAQAGAAGTPSFNTEVAMFTQLRGGLLLEGSVGAHRYTFRPLASGTGPGPDRPERNQTSLR